MRNKRQLFGALALAAIVSVALPLSADTGAMGGPLTSTCAFIDGLQMRGLPAVAAAILEALFGC